jgi:hypothetical protein
VLDKQCTILYLMLRPQMDEYGVDPRKQKLTNLTTQLNNSLRGFKPSSHSASRRNNFEEKNSVSHEPLSEIVEKPLTVKVIIHYWVLDESAPILLSSPRV